MNGPHESTSYSEAEFLEILAGAPIRWLVIIVVGVEIEILSLDGALVRAQEVDRDIIL